jgi:hypothetical protein
MNVPKSPDMPLLPEDTQRRTRGIETDPVSRKEMIKGNVDYHDLSGMVARLIGR